MAICGGGDPAPGIDGFVLGDAIRNGDLSHLSFKRLISATRVGLWANADYPNNRGVAFMILDPAPADGPVYPPLFDD
ncbi:MAG: hypothetical protein R8J94_11365 [Acidimicrobiia bacterium]|nr:hypothetical protein [Acidimicrobiia bacterium]